MKKKTKIILFSVIGVLVIAAVAFGVIFALDSADSNTTTGTVMSGTGEYEWRKTDAHIAFGTQSSESFYSNCDRDHIYNVEFKLGVKQTSKASHTSVYCIEYDQDFSIFDDLIVFFELTDGTNTYTTKTETADTPYGSDCIYIPLKDIDENYYINAVWVMTED